MYGRWQAPPGAELPRWPAWALASRHFAECSVRRGCWGRAAVLAAGAGWVQVHCLHWADRGCHPVPLEPGCRIALARRGAMFPVRRIVPWEAKGAEGRPGPFAHRPAAKIKGRIRAKPWFLARQFGARQIRVQQPDAHWPSNVPMMQHEVSLAHPPLPILPSRPPIPRHHRLHPRCSLQVRANAQCDAAGSPWRVCHHWRGHHPMSGRARAT